MTRGGASQHKQAAPIMASWLGWSKKPAEVVRLALTSMSGTTEEVSVSWTLQRKKFAADTASSAIAGQEGGCEAGV